MPLGCRNVFTVCANVQSSEKVKEFVTQPSVSIQAVPLPAVTDFVYRNKKKLLIGTCEGWHVHESPIEIKYNCVVLIVYYSPCTAVFLQIWFTVSLIL